MLIFMQSFVEFQTVDLEIQKKSAKHDLHTYIHAFILILTDYPSHRVRYKLTIKMYNV